MYIYLIFFTLSNCLLLLLGPILWIPKKIKTNIHLKSQLNIRIRVYIFANSGVLIKFQGTVAAVAAKQPNARANPINNSQRTCTRVRATTATMTIVVVGLVASHSCAPTKVPRASERSTTTVYNYKAHVWRWFV